MDAHQKVELQNDRQKARARDNSRAKAYGNYPENDFRQEIMLEDGQSTAVTITYHDDLQWCARVATTDKGALIADLQAAVKTQTKLDLGSGVAWGEGYVYLELN